MKDSVMVCLYQGTGGNLGVLFFFFFKEVFQFCNNQKSFRFDIYG